MPSRPFWDRFRSGRSRKQGGSVPLRDNLIVHDGGDGHASTSTLSGVSSTQLRHAPGIDEIKHAKASSSRQSLAHTTTSCPPAQDAPSAAKAASASADTGNLPASLSEHLWDRAYNELKVNESKLLQAYEKILSCKLRGQECESPGSDFEQNIIEQDDTKERQNQMRQLIRDGLEKTAREAKVKEYIGTAMDVVLAAKGMISSAVEAVPQAALAWTGICVALEMLQNPLSATKANREGIEYVMKRMDWYWELSSLVLKKDKFNQSDLSGVQRELESKIVDLYKALLSYEIKSVCSYYRHRGLVLLGDIVQLDNWDGSLKSIQDAENGFHVDYNTYMSQKTNSNLEQLVTHAKMQLTTQMTEKDHQCLKDLCITDPRDDKGRIQQTKGGLLQGSYRWILDNPDFKQWGDNPESRLLWIRGDPGKGKTMLLCGIVDELNKQPNHSNLLSYFFCQATDQRINNATAVLRGLMFMLAEQRPSLISHIRKKYDITGGALFKGVNAWHALSSMFSEMLGDLELEGDLKATTAYLIIDALDECVSYRQELLDLVVQTSRTSACVKWIVSSRNWSDIEERLRLAESKEMLSLELNAESVANAVDIYIQNQVLDLKILKDYSEKLCQAVRDDLSNRADGTFLWVALVCQNLRGQPARRALATLKAFPSDLKALYVRMMEQVLRIDDENDVYLCKQILAVATSVYQPVTVCELCSLIESHEDLSVDVKLLKEIVALCGSFLTIRDDTIYFVHQSAKDHLTENEAAYSAIFPSDGEDVHYAIFSRSLQAMDKTLRSDIYTLLHPGFPVDEIKIPDPDPLAAIRYSSVHWIRHLCEASKNSSGTAPQDDLDDQGPVFSFLQKHFLHWLEALSILRHVADGIISLTRLESLLRAQLPDGQLLKFIQDARRFIRHSKMAIEIAPLQAYSSALLFSPMQSFIRTAFNKNIPSWISIMPIIEDNWSPCLQTLEGHSNPVNSVAFSADNKQIVSASDDKIVKIWDTDTGVCIQTLEGHSSSVNSVAFSADSKKVASGSADKTVKIWDTDTGVCIQTLECHTSSVNPVAFSADSKQVALGSDGNTVKIWDIDTGVCIHTLEGHSSWVRSVAFSEDSKRVASGSYDKTVKIWNTDTGVCIQTLEGHSNQANSVAFSADSKQVASVSDDKTVKIWDIDTGVCIKTLDGPTSSVNSVAFSADSKQVALGSDDNAVKIWDIDTGVCIQTLEGHNNLVFSVAFSADSKQMASGSADNTVKIWDTDTGVGIQTLEGHSSWVSSVAFSEDSKQVASGSGDKTVKIWNIDTGVCIHTLEGHNSWVNSMAFSVDSKQVASGSVDKTVKIWDIDTGICIQTLEGHSSWVSSVAFSADSKQVASGSDDKTVKIWDIDTGVCIQTLEGHSKNVWSVAFSADSKKVASGSDDNIVKIWDTDTGACIQTLEGHSNVVISVAFSADSMQMASGSADNTVKIWDTDTGICIQTRPVGIATQLSFDSSTDARLQTNLGGLNLDMASRTDKPLTVALPIMATDYGYGIDSTSSWIVKDGKPMLWLPPAYRPIASATIGSTVAVGCASGRVWVLQFR